MSELGGDLLVLDLGVEAPDPAYIEKALLDDLAGIRRELLVLRCELKVIGHAPVLRGGSFHVLSGPHFLHAGLRLFGLTCRPLPLQAQVLIVEVLRQDQGRLLAVKPGGRQHILAHHLLEIVEDRLPALAHGARQLSDLHILAGPRDLSVFIVLPDQLFPLLSLFDQDAAQDRKSGAYDQGENAPGIEKAP